MTPTPRRKLDSEWKLQKRAGTVLSYGAPGHSRAGLLRRLAAGSRRQWRLYRLLRNERWKSGPGGGRRLRQGCARRAADVFAAQHDSRVALRADLQSEDAGAGTSTSCSPRSVRTTAMRRCLSANTIRRAAAYITSTRGTNRLSCCARAARISGPIFLEASGPVIGMLRESSYREGVVSLQPGDVLVAYTDGLCETTNRAGEEWGWPRLLKTVEDCADQRARDIVEGVMQTAECIRRRRDAK